MATYSNASAGFLVFVGVSSARYGRAVGTKNVLLYPEDIEKLIVVVGFRESGCGMMETHKFLALFGHLSHWFSCHSHSLEDAR